MSECLLYLVRHAQAAARGADFPDDAARPLVAKGERQAERLPALFGALGVQFDRVFTSPYERAVQTARPLAGRLRERRRLEELDALVGDDPLALLEALRAQLRPGDHELALVGHEPLLGALAALLLCGHDDALQLKLRKASTTALAGRLEAQGMRLELLLPMRVVKRLQR